MLVRKYSPHPRLMVIEYLICYLSVILKES